MYIEYLYLHYRLVLLREVPILQTMEERVQFQEKHSGSHNIVFSYQKAIGTFGKLVHVAQLVFQSSWTTAVA